MLRAALPAVFCLLVFFFALHAKTAVYGAANQARITPSTASKLWSSGQKFDVDCFAPQSAPLFWPVLLTLLGLFLCEQPFIKAALIVPPPGNLRLRHLHRFLRPPPFQN
jgi:hypothetical protein